MMAQKNRQILKIHYFPFRNESILAAKIEEKNQNFWQNKSKKEKKLF